MRNPVLKKIKKICVCVFLECISVDGAFEASTVCFFPCKGDVKTAVTGTLKNVRGCIMQYNNTLFILGKFSCLPLSLTHSKKYRSKSILYSFIHLIRIKA